jgi:hypothetical protein
MSEIQKTPVRQIQATVMFLDVTGFMPISDRIGSEQAYLHFSAWLQFLDSIARHYGAAVDLSTAPATPGPHFVGSTIRVAVDVSGLTAGTFPSVTAIELDLGFDATKLSFVSASFLPVLGFGMTTCPPIPFDPLCEAVIDISSSAGNVTLAAASLLAPAVIDTDQPAAATVALIEFLAIMDGSSLLAFTALDVAATSATGEGPVVATGGSLGVLVNVPEPGTALLLSMGLLALRATRKRR